jgi:tetraacyldisaccharide 4'-kinase
MMSFQKALQEIWYPHNDRLALQVVPRLLIPLSSIYERIIRTRNYLYDRKFLKTCHLPCPVISVGNVTVGGTGKTPAVIMIAQMLAARGWRPAVLSRGYGGASRSPVNIVSDGHSLLMTARDAGDEPVLMAGRLPGIPVVTGPERRLTGKAAIGAFGVDVLVLDDAFQHRQIHRDINILLIDGRHPAGNGRALPAGPLREPVSAMNRADIVIITGEGRDSDTPSGETSQNNYGICIPSGIPVFKSRHRPLELIPGELPADAQPCDRIAGRRICAFAGIGSPEAFRDTLLALGGHVVSFLAFPDHHSYTQKDVYDINGAAEKGAAELIITTEKDGVKLDPFPELKRRVFMLRIAMDLKNAEEDFADAIVARIASWKKPGQRP